MQFKVIVFVASQILAVLALERKALPVLTAQKVYHTVINESPFLVERTSTITWTESASIVDPSLPTVIPTPTIGY